MCSCDFCNSIDLYLVVRDLWDVGIVSTFVGSLFGCSLGVSWQHFVCSEDYCVTHLCVGVVAVYVWLGHLCVDALTYLNCS